MRRSGSGRPGGSVVGGTVGRRGPVGDGVADVRRRRRGGRRRRRRVAVPSPTAPASGGPSRRARHRPASPRCGTAVPRDPPRPGRAGPGTPRASSEPVGADRPARRAHDLGRRRQPRSVRFRRGRRRRAAAPPWRPRRPGPRPRPPPRRRPRPAAGDGPLPPAAARTGPAATSPRPRSASDALPDPARPSASSVLPPSAPPSCPSGQSGRAVRGYHVLPTRRRPRMTRSGLGRLRLVQAEHPTCRLLRCCSAARSARCRPSSR